MLDITAPREIDIQIREDGKVVWIHANADGYDPTVFRACRIGKLTISDDRKAQVPSYSELVRALAFLVQLFSEPHPLTMNERAALESARKLLLRAQVAQ